MPDNMNNPEETPNGEEEIQTDQESQRKGITRRNFILGGLSALGLAALGEGARRTLNKGSDEVATDPTLEPATPPPTFTPTPESIPTPEPVREYPEFMPDAKRNIYGDTSLATDSEYPDRKECPDPNVLFKTTTCSSMNELVASGEIENSSELLNQGIEEAYAVAWARTVRKMTLDEVIANYDDIISEYKEKKQKGEDVSPVVSAYTAESEYIEKRFVNVPSDYTTEIDYVPLPNKYTSIELTSSFKVGFVIDSQRKKFHWVIYDFAAGGVGNRNPEQAIPETYHASGAIAWAGIIMGDREGQINEKYLSHNINPQIPLLYKLHEKLIPYKSPSQWKGVVVAE